MKNKKCKDKWLATRKAEEADAKKREAANKSAERKRRAAEKKRQAVQTERHNKCMKNKKKCKCEPDGTFRNKLPRAWRNPKVYRNCPLFGKAHCPKNANVQKLCSKTCCGIRLEKPKPPPPPSTVRFHCRPPSGGKKPKLIVSNFKAEFKGGKQACPEAAAVIAGVYAKDKKGSYLAARDATVKEFMKNMKNAVDYKQCAPKECKDPSSPLWKHTDNRGRVHNQHRNYCGGQVCKVGGKGCPACEPLHSDWSRRKLNLKRWETKPNHRDWLSLKKNRVVLEDELEKAAQRIKNDAGNPDKVRMTGSMLWHGHGGRYFLDGAVANIARHSLSQATFGSIKSGNRGYEDRSHGGSGVRNCCWKACGPRTISGTRPIMWDQDALTPFDFKKYAYAGGPWEVPRNVPRAKLPRWNEELGKIVGATKPNEFFRKHKLRRLKTGQDPYPAACKIPKDGIPKDAHIIRVSPCGGERDIVFCAVIKITEIITPGKDAKLELLVDGHGSIEKAFGLGTANVRNQQQKEQSFLKKCQKEYQKTGQWPDRSCPPRDGFDRLFSSSDGMIRDAIARVRFWIAQGKLWELQGRKGKRKAQGKRKGKSRHDLS